MATTSPLPPTTTVNLPELRILTKELPKASVGSNYEFQLLAEGGKPPYTWSVHSGDMSNGLKLSENGLISGFLEDSAETLLVFSLEDSNKKALISQEFSLESESERRTVVARGGTTFIDIDGDLVSLFLVSPADGYSAVIVEPGGFRVEVQFVPIQGDSTSYVVCEVNDGVVCNSD